MSCPCIRSFCSHQFSLHRPQRTVSPLRRTTPAQATSRQLGTPLAARGADARGAVCTHADAAARPTGGRGGGSGAAVRRLKRAQRRGRRPSPRAGRGGPPRRPRAAPARVGIDAPHFPRTRRGPRAGPARSTPDRIARRCPPRLGAIPARFGPAWPWATTRPSRPSRPGPTAGSRHGRGHRSILVWKHTVLGTWGHPWRAEFGQARPWAATQRGRRRIRVGPACRFGGRPPCRRTA